MEYAQTAIELARAAGDVLKHYARRDKQVELKGRSNLVTIADKESEELLIGELRRRFPDHRILSEEAGLLTRGDSTVPQWIIDPLDGTTNFAHQFPFYCVSIAVEVRDTVVCGAVYDPVRDEMFHGVEGGGAYRNGERLSVSAVPSLGEALLLTGFPYSFRERFDYITGLFDGFLMESQAVRRGGSAALDLCYLACGRCDGFWEVGLNPWDTAAGALIAREAGATLTDFGGQPFSVYVPEILASNGRFHPEMLEVVRLKRELLQTS